MALEENKDFVFVPVVDVIMDKACMLGTREYIYRVMDQVEVEQGFWESVLSNTVQVQTITLGDKSPREVIQELLLAEDLTLEGLHEFMAGLLKQYKGGVQILQLEFLKSLKVSAGWFGGSITYRDEQDFGYKPLVTRIPGSHKKQVKAFYEDIAAAINNKKK